MRKIIAGLALAALAAGCDSEGAIQLNLSNDISVSPMNITFPRVVPPQFDVQVITVRHAGEKPLRVDRIYIEGFEGAEECSRANLGYEEADNLPEDVKARCPLIIDVMPELPITLDNLAFEDINLRFQPVDSEVPSGIRVVIESNVIDKPQVFVNIDFQRAQPQISAPAVVSFQPGVPATEFLIVQNIGSGPLTVQAPTLRLISDPAINPETQQPVDEFTISAITAFPWTVDESRSETLDITYTPYDGNRDTAELTFESNDTQTPSFVVQLTSAPVFGILSVEPNPVSFAVPNVGGATERMITLRNAGVRYVDVNDIAIDQPGEDYRLGGNQQTSYRIGGGDSRTITVVYQPRGDGSGSSATLNIRYDDGNDATPDTLAVPMAPEGAALPPVLNIDPVAVSLDDVARGETRTVDLTLTNSGGADLEISRISMSEDGDPAVPSDPEFSITAGGGATTIAPGANHTVTVSFTRGEADSLVHVAAVVIESNAASSPDVVSFTSNPPNE